MKQYYIIELTTIFYLIIEISQIILHLSFIFLNSFVARLKKAIWVKSLIWESIIYLWAL